MIKGLKFIAVCLALWSCSSSTDELDNYFETTQLEELNRLTEFVVTKLIIDCDNDRTACLIAYFDRLKEAGHDFELTGISQSEQDELINSLSGTTYNDIWTTCTKRRSFSRDSIVNVESLCPNMNGRFANFLTNYCSKTDRLTDYRDAFKQAGSYSPAMNAQLIKNPESFDFSSQAELLLISVHLLTLNNEDKIVESVP